MNTRHRSHGQSLVEFALCLPLLIVIMLGIFDLGRAFHAFVIISNSAREGAYYAAMHPDDATGVVNRCLAEAHASGVALTSANISLATSGVSGSPATVSVQFPFALLWSQLVPGQVIPLRASAQMLVY